MILTRMNLQRLMDPDRVASAIREAESACAAEIRVSVSGALWGDPRKRAEKAFVRMGMARTEGRNGLLIYLMPHRRRFAVLGDQAIHEAMGQTFWDALAKDLSAGFASGDFTGALERCIADAGRRLAARFPSQGPNPDELPNQIDLDP